MPNEQTSAAPFAINLTAQEVFRLLEDKSPDVLIDLTEKIAGAYTHAGLKNAESQAAEQIFRLLLRDTELKVRVSLAEHVKKSTTIPRDIVMSLARDVEEVSLPILEHSEVLDDSDLLELLDNTQEITKYLAVSRREQVSNIVTDTLLQKGNDEVAATLVSNKGAEISTGGFEKIIQQYPKNQTLMDAMGGRPHLPLAVTEKLINVVSTKLADTLKEKYRVPAKDIEQEADKARENETLSLLRTSKSLEEISKLVNQLHSFNRLTPSMILSALCQGNFGFFEASLARLSNIPAANARTLINDRGDLGFRAVYNKSGLPDSMFPAVKLLLRVVHELDEEGEKPGGSLYTNNVVERLLHHSESHAVENLSYIIALVRRNAS